MQKHKCFVNRSLVHFSFCLNFSLILIPFLLCSEFLDKDVNAVKGGGHTSRSGRKSAAEMSVTESYVEEFSKTKTAAHPVSMGTAAVTHRETDASVFFEQYAVMQENRRRLSTQQSTHRQHGHPFDIAPPSRPLTPLPTDGDRDTAEAVGSSQFKEKEKQKKITFKLDATNMLSAGTHEQVLSEESYDNLQLEDINDLNLRMDDVERGITERDAGHSTENEMHTPTSAVIQMEHDASIRAGLFCADT